MCDVVSGPCPHAHVVSPSQYIVHNSVLYVYTILVDFKLVSYYAKTVVVAHPTPFRRRFNTRKAYWDSYSTEPDKLIEDVEPIPEQHERREEEMGGGHYINRHVVVVCLPIPMQGMG